MFMAPIIRRIYQQVQSHNRCKRRSPTQKYSIIPNNTFTPIVTGQSPGNPGEHSCEDEEDEEALSDDEHSRALEDQMRTMNDDLTALKNLKASKDKKKPKKEKPPHLSTSKPSKPKPLEKRKEIVNADVSEDDFLTFDQKKGLKELFEFDDNDVPICENCVK
ncbi:uncharacterized protein ARMOST_04735 [Armillaria ostoyae]|uniref:Uncharacterized protein n=1 Tax=Armillaria ostoyae TaxID=47428 RepID=A0A284QY54_ARMOS|nr:uncharacterized protein ARMOST_04735 [Armillaria ostoyae]